jgi:hypothetical protein
VGIAPCAEYSVEIILCDLPFYEGDNKLLLSFYGAKDNEASPQQAAGNVPAEIQSKRR